MRLPEEWRRVLPSRTPREIIAAINPMPTIQQQIADRLKVFQQTNNFEALSDAVELVESLNASVKQASDERHRIRAEKLKLWFVILNHIDAKLAPDFDPENVPELSVTPPPETGLPAGVDPGSITNPRLKAKYEEAIKANQKKAEDYRLQKYLRRHEHDIEEQTEAYISTAYSIAEVDVKEVFLSIAEHVTAPRRKAKFEKFVKAWQSR